MCRRTTRRLSRLGCHATQRRGGPIIPKNPIPFAAVLWLSPPRQANKSGEGHLASLCPMRFSLSTRDEPPAVPLAWNASASARMARPGWSLLVDLTHVVPRHHGISLHTCTLLDQQGRRHRGGGQPPTRLRLYLCSCRGARQPLNFAGSGQGALASSPLASMGREPPRWRPIIGVTPAATKSNPTRAWRGRGARPPGGAPVAAAQARRSRPQRSCHAWRERRSVAPLHYGGGGGEGSASTRTCPPRCTVAEPDCVALTATLACESGPAPPSLSSAPATFRSAPTVWGEGVLHLLY